jgi:hypothetical protein
MVMRFLLFGFLFVLALAAIALISVLAADKGQVRRLPRGLWVVLILLVPVVGPGLYLWLGRPGRRDQAGPGTERSTPARSKKPLAPDDDPEFLRRLRNMPPGAPAPKRDNGPAAVDPWADQPRPTQPKNPEDLRSGDERDA